MLSNGESREGPQRERRACAREEVDSEASIYLIDLRALVVGRVMDVSLSGCCIRSKARFPVGIYRRVEVEFKLGGTPFRLAGVVQSLPDRYTVGIRLLDLSERKREQLSELMQDLERARERVSSATEEPPADVR